MFLRRRADIYLSFSCAEPNRIVWRRRIYIIFWVVWNRISDLFSDQKKLPHTHITHKRGSFGANLLISLSYSLTRQKSAIHDTRLKIDSAQTVEVKFASLGGAKSQAPGVRACGSGIWMHKINGKSVYECGQLRHLKSVARALCAQGAAPRSPQLRAGVE